MRRFLDIAFLVCLAVCQAVIAVSCSDSINSAETDTDTALLLMRVESAASRAGSRDIPDNELIHTLRLIIIDENGKVERNYFTDLSSPATDYRYPYKIPVTPGKKKIFFIANEASVKYYDGGTLRPLSDLVGYIPESETDMAGKLNSVVFKPDYSLDMPLTSMYDVTLQRGENEQTFYVVRAATRFDINFVNRRHSDVTVRKVTLSRFADRSFLLGQVGETDYTKESEYWVDWLAGISDESQNYPEDPDNQEFNSRVGWIKDYSVPSNAVTADFVRSDIGKVTGWRTEDGTDTTPGTLAAGSYYIPESRNLKSGATDGTQLYRITLELEEDGKTYTFTEDLANLEALFRNTHMVIDITFSGGLTDINVEIDVQPYTEVILKPEYGIMRDKLGHYMILPEGDKVFPEGTPQYFRDFINRYNLVLPGWTPVKGDYYAIVPPADGDMTKAEIWLKDFQGNRVEENFHYYTDQCTKPSNMVRKVTVFFANDSYEAYMNTDGHRILQHNDNHTLLAYNPEGMLVFVPREEGDPMEVESWDESTGNFWVIYTDKFVEYSISGEPTGKTIDREPETTEP